MLPDYIDLLEYVVESDGAGGYSKSTKAAQLNPSPLNCRITVMMGEKYKEKYGYAGPNYRHVYIEPASDLFKNNGNQYIVLSQGAPTSVVSTTDVFRVIAFTNQRDKNGVLHHSTVIAEYDSAMSGDA